MNNWFKHIAVLILTLSMLNSYAQDIHFSQWTTTPTFINPAAAGTYGGDYRAYMNFKEQYSGFSNAYRTFRVGYDAPIVKERGLKKIGLGGDVFQDLAGDSKTRLIDVKLSASYTSQITDYADLSFGIGVGAAWLTANYQGLRWGDQYNGVDYDETLPTNEIFFGRNQYYFDFSVGAMYRYFDYDGFPWEFGLSAAHLSRPNVDVIRSTDVLDRLPMKFILHGKKEFEFSQDWDRYGIVPKFMVAVQRRALEVVAGAVVRYDVSLHSKYTGYYKNSTIFAGVSYRYNDAIIPEFYLNLKEKYTFGLSYDINVSKLNVASNYQGGLEVSLSMAGFINERYKVVSPVTF